MPGRLRRMPRAKRLPGPLRHVDPGRFDGPYQRQVDHEAALGYGKAEYSVAPAADSDLKGFLTREAHRRRHVAGAAAAGDHHRAPGHHRIHNAASLFVVVRATEQDLPAESAAEAGHIWVRNIADPFIPHQPLL